MTQQMKSLIDLLKHVYTSSTDKTIKLGRWSLKDCKTSQATTFYANRDHCGEKLCKQPKKYDDVLYSNKNIS